MIISRTPFRITLGGGGTDLPNFYEKHGGFVVSAAIDKYVYITLKPDFYENLIKLKYSISEIVDTIDQLKHDRVRESLRQHGLYRGLEISTCADISSNTGLGSSGSFLVGFLNCVREYLRKPRHPEILANEACIVEMDILKEPVGKQDQYIASYGGMSILDIDRRGNVDVKPIALSNQKISEFLSNIQVYNSNVKRNASDILKTQASSKSTSTENSLLKIKEFGYKTVEILEKENYDEYGLLLDKHWKEKKSLSSDITLKSFDTLYETVKLNYGVLGGKIIGAGGGGFYMLYCPFGNGSKKLQSFMEGSGHQRLNFSLDYSGSKILGNF